MANKDLSLGNLILPSAHNSVSYGTPKQVEDNIGQGLSTEELVHNLCLPFENERPVEITENTQISSIQSNRVLVLKNPCNLTLCDADFQGCRLVIINNAQSPATIYYASGDDQLISPGEDITLIADENRRWKFLQDKEDLNAHIGSTSVHGATSNAEANRIAMRDGDGKIKVTNIRESDNGNFVTDKKYVDDQIRDKVNAAKGDLNIALETHKNDKGWVHGATPNIENGKIVARDMQGRIKITTKLDDEDNDDMDEYATNKGYVKKKLDEAYSKSTGYTNEKFENINQTLSGFVHVSVSGTTLTILN